MHVTVVFTVPDLLHQWRHCVSKMERHWYAGCFLGVDDALKYAFLTGVRLGCASEINGSLREWKQSFR
jgi:hypothetical protein